MQDDKLWEFGKKEFFKPVFRLQDSELVIGQKEEDEEDDEEEEE